MAMDLGGAKGGVKSDINVTPLVDVMLVLLIIMMLVAPLLQQGVSVRLPAAEHNTPKPETQGQAVIAIAANRAVYFNARPVAENELGQRVSEFLDTQLEKVVFIKADEDAEYGAVMDAMDQLRQVGIEDVGLITEPLRASGATGGQ